MGLTGGGGARCVHRVKGDGHTYTRTRAHFRGLCAFYVFVHGNRTGRVYTVGRKNLPTILRARFFTVFRG